MDTGIVPMKEGQTSAANDQQQQLQQVPQDQPAQQFRHLQGLYNRPTTVEQNQEQQEQQEQQHHQQQQEKQEQGPAGDLSTAQQHEMTSTAEDPQSRHSIDFRLDFTSTEFDPQLALQTEDLQLPVPDAPVLDNISRCAGMVQAADNQGPQQVQQQDAASAQEVG